MVKINKKITAKYFIAFSLILINILCINFNGILISAVNFNLTSAKSMIVIETSANKVLYSKNELEKLPMASTTKIVTAITVIENCEDIDKIIEVPRMATRVEGSSIYLKEGERLTIRQLLYGLILQSGNDAAETLALEVGKGSIENFANLMNETAKKCGASNSNFVTPHGLDDKNHYTTAKDLAIITSYALKNPIFKEIVSTKSYKILGGEKTISRTLINKNKLLSSLEGCIGVKTGFTKKSGRCLVSACERDNMQIVCVVLNCGPMFEDSANLINKAFKEYKKFEILPSYKFIDDCIIENGEKNKVRLYNKIGYSVVTSEQDAKNYFVKFNYKKNIEAPIQKDKKLGEVEVYYKNTLIFKENLCSIEEVKSIENSDKIKEILDKW